MTLKPKQETYLWLDHFFEFIFSLAYRFGIIPYDIKYNEDQQRFSLTTSRFRQNLCLCLTLATLAFSIILAINGFSQASLRSPAIIFRIAPEFGDEFLCLTLWYVIWMRKNDVAALFSLMSLKSYVLWRSNSGFTLKGRLDKKALLAPSTSSSRKKDNIRSASLCTVIFILVLTFDLIKMYGYTNEFHPGTPFGNFYECLRIGTFMESQPPKKTQDMTVFELGVTIIGLVIMCYFKVFKVFALLLCIAATAVIFKNSCDLVKLLRTETDQLSAFRDFLDATNQVTGPLMFAIGVVCAPTFYVANLTKLLVTWAYDSPITWITVMIYGFVLLAAAEVTDKTDEVREWILQSGSGPYEQQLFGMYVDLTQSPVGLRGLECFTVTHSFLAQLYSAVVSFTIILLQFQAE